MTQVITEVVTGAALTEAQVETAAMLYEQHRTAEDGAVSLGLYGEDLRRSIQHVGTVLLKYAMEDGEEPVYSPALVPTSTLEWYNHSFLQERYGEDADMYCYVHPYVPEDEHSRSLVAEAVRSVADKGAVVMWDEYRGKPPFALAAGDNAQEAIVLGADETGYVIEELGGSEDEKKSDIFVAHGDILGNENGTFAAPSLYEVYTEAVANGTIEADPENGPSIEVVLSDEDIEHVWDIYEKPFARLTEGSPVLNGFDEDSLKMMLKDPTVTKMVHRLEGAINCVAIFTQDFAHYPWFNADYFKRTYPEYFEAENVFLFPGIVSDETMRGKAYSLPLIDLASKVFALRGPDVLLSFECSEISTKYVPKIVKMAIDGSGVATANTLEKPVATMQYRALRAIPAAVTSAE